ncbi:hypothetical protein M409DRAFT_25177 [Zasmidium cellare ATCC 36951]|uniref:Uncharacterized protein n=1 Tax=Zasmidium cellare ATCC 36951 TaxID=1080233 RepID=A0A6A6CDP6_ZASCE|nr:uncharacterized protein M409DRAFT_25177 [Zasmidium cellare ATCC 36951]KAF2164298.1 hypothetical protein M409DRAFT_25177 [Zasmidium cellare ATCC 36951]
MSLQDGEARKRRLLERKQLLREQQAINKQMLAIFDEEDERSQQETPLSQQDALATFATHPPSRRTSEANMQTLRQ